MVTLSIPLIATFSGFLGMHWSKTAIFNRLPKSKRRAPSATSTLIPSVSI